MYTCPACGADGVMTRSRCRCGADLSLLRYLDAVPDAWFNQALEAIAAGKPGRALEWLAACCAARPNDAAALRALAKLWGQLGHAPEALDALRRAATIEPDAPRLEEVRAALGPLTGLRRMGRRLGQERQRRRGRRLGTAPRRQPRRPAASSRDRAYLIGARSAGRTKKRTCRYLGGLVPRGKLGAASG